MLASGFEGIYCGPAPNPSDLWLQWNFDPPLVLALAMLASLIGRRPFGLAAIGVLVVVFVSPLCALSAALFSARVIHHVLLVAVAAPLLAVAWPNKTARSPTTAFIVSTATLWAWHLPAAYDLALGNKIVYWVMQASLLGSATLLWRVVLNRHQHAANAILFIFASYIQMALLGALLTLAPDQLYAIHAFAPMNWGLAPLADQQLGGLIMWMPAGLPYLAIGALIARRTWRAMGEPS